MQPDMDEYLQTGRYRTVSLDIGCANIPETLTLAEAEERIKKLAGIRHDLEAATVAIKALEIDATQKKAEHEKAKKALSDVRADVDSAEALLRIPEDSFARLLVRANKRSRLRGIVEGVLIGFATGALSSFFIWYVTK